MRRAAAIVAVGVPVTVLVSGRMYREQHRPSLPPYEQHDMRGRAVVLTGGTSGIGLAAASNLAALGARVVLGSRDPARGEAARAIILASAADADVRVLPLDTSNARSVSTFARAAAEACGGRVDVLVGAAGEVRYEAGATSSGVDLGFATNHLGLQGLVGELEPALVHGGDSRRPSRVVIVGSKLERRGEVDVDAIEATRGGRLRAGPSPDAFDPMRCYADTKHANMLLATHLAERWRAGGAPTAVFSVTPGMVNTGLWSHYPLWYRALTFPLRAVALRTPEEGAAGVVFAATATALDAPARSGAYLADGRDVEPSGGSRDAAKAHRLFEVCQGIIARDSQL